MYLKSYRAQSLRDSVHIRGEVVTCLQLPDRAAAPAPVLLLDPRDPACSRVFSNVSAVAAVAGVLIIEDWEYRSSSPYPRHHKHLSLQQGGSDLLLGSLEIVIFSEGALKTYS